MPATLVDQFLSQASEYHYCTVEGFSYSRMERRVFTRTRNYVREFLRNHRTLLSARSIELEGNCDTLIARGGSWCWRFTWTVNRDRRYTNYRVASINFSHQLPTSVGLGIRAYREFRQSLRG